MGKWNATKVHGQNRIADDVCLIFLTFFNGLWSNREEREMGMACNRGFMAGIELGVLPSCGMFSNHYSTSVLLFFPTINYLLRPQSSSPIEAEEYMMKGPHWLFQGQGQQHPLSVQLFLSAFLLSSTLCLRACRLYWHQARFTGTWAQDPIPTALLKSY